MRTFLEKIDYWWILVVFLFFPTLLLENRMMGFYYFAVLIGFIIFAIAKKYFIAGFFILITVLGYYQWNNFELNKSYNELRHLVGKDVVIEGKIVDFVDYRFNKNIVTISANKVYFEEEEIFINSKTKIRVSTNNQGEKYIGDLIKIRGKIKKPQPFTTEAGRDFYYDRYLASDKILYVVNNSEIIQINHRENFLNWLEKNKNNLVNRIILNHSFDSGSIMVGMLLGDGRYLSEKMEDSFRKTGLIHILVLSGYNVLLVSGSIIFLLGFWSSRFKYLLAILAIIVFIIFTGFQTTVLRAGVMIILFFIAKLFGLKYTPLRALVFVIILFYAISPLTIIYDAGFILSVLATLGIFIVLPFFENLNIFNKLPKILRDILYLTLSTQIMVMPYVLFSFGQWSLISIFSNLIIIPFIPFLMLSAGIVTLVSFLNEGLAFWLGKTISIFSDLIISIISWLAKIPFASQFIPYFPFWLMLVFYIFIIWFFIFSKSQKTKAI